MKPRFTLFRRSGVFYCEDTTTGKQSSLRLGVSSGTRVIHCQHPNGSISFLAHHPKAGERPALLLQVRHS